MQKRRHTLALQNVNRIIEELSRPFNDGEHIIYVNGDYGGSDDIGKPMNDFRSSKVDDMILEPLKETVNRYKNNPREVAAMCADLEKWSMDERSEGRAEGRAEERKSVARNLKAMGLDLQAIEQATGLSQKEIESL